MSIRTDFEKQRLFGIDFDVVTMRDAVDWFFRKVAIGRQSHCRFVVTPNVNLTLRHQNEANFRRIVHHADLTICDGQPLVRLSQWFKKQLPERVAGSDFVFQIFEAAVPEMPLKVFLLGAAPGVAVRARGKIHGRWDGVQVVGVCSPKPGFEKCEEQNQKIVKQINHSKADVVIIGLGAPKQETWAFDHRFELNTAVALCVGGTIDFLAGEQTRAPRIVRRLGVEWAWRIATHPSRLAKRYLKDGLRLPGLILDELSHLCPAYEADVGVGGESREAALDASANKRTLKPRIAGSEQTQSELVKLRNAESRGAVTEPDTNDSEGGILLFADYLRAKQEESTAE